MIKDNIDKIRKELPSGVTLVAVSKYHPVEAIKEAYEAGELKKSIIYFGKVIQKDAKYKEAQNR